METVLSAGIAVSVFFTCWFCILPKCYWRATLQEYILFLKGYFSCLYVQGIKKLVRLSCIQKLMHTVYWQRFLADTTSKGLFQDVHCKICDKEEIQTANYLVTMICISLCLSCMFRNPFIFIIVPFVCAGAIYLFVSSHIKRDEKQAIDAIPGLFRSIASALASGKTLMQAIEYVGIHRDDIIGEAFARSSLLIQCGIPIHAALKSITDKITAPGISMLVVALEISQRTGAPLEKLFQNCAAIAEKRSETEQMLVAKTAQARMSMRMVCILPLVLVCILICISPDFRSGICSPVGFVCICLALCLDIAALFIMNKIMKGVRI